MTIVSRVYSDGMDNDMATVVGSIDGVAAELDYDPTDDECPVGGRMELDHHTWRDLSYDDESDRKLIDRFKESA